MGQNRPREVMHTCFFFFRSHMFDEMHAFFSIFFPKMGMGEKPIVLPYFLGE